MPFYLDALCHCLSSSFLGRILLVSQTCPWLTCHAPQDYDKLAEDLALTWHCSLKKTLYFAYFILSYERKTDPDDTFA